MDRILKVLKVSTDFNDFYANVMSLRNIPQNVIDEFFGDHSHLATKEAALDFYNKYKS